MKKNFWLILILIVFLITLGTFVYHLRFRNTISPSENSLSTNNAFSTSNSYVFSSPIRAKAGGDLIRITVFLLDEQGNGVYGNKVSLQTDSNVLVSDIQSLTDETGRAIFDLSSSVSGSYAVKALNGSIFSEQNLKVIFD